MERRAACTYLSGDEFWRFSILVSSHPRRVRRHGAASTQSAPDASAEDGNGESPGHVVVMEADGRQVAAALDLDLGAACAELSDPRPLWGAVKAISIDRPRRGLFGAANHQSAGQKAGRCSRWCAK